MTTTQTNHTPGPWRVCGGYTPHYIAIAAGDALIVSNFCDRQHTLNAVDAEQQQANARLIAAAPEMLQALYGCKWLLETLVKMDRIPANSDALREALAAIAKAGA